MRIIKEVWEKIRSDSSSDIFKWDVDIDGIIFTLPRKRFDAVESLAINNLLLGMQYVALKSLEEQGVASRFANGFSVAEQDAVELLNEDSDSFCELFKLPRFFSPKIQVNFDGLTTQASFNVTPKLSTPDGRKTYAYKLEGPFLSFGSRQYSLNVADWSFLKAIEKHKKLSGDERSELKNNRLIYQLQSAVKQGCNASLEHFDTLVIHQPEKVGIFVNETANGDLELTPSLGGGASEENITRRLGNIANLEQEGMFKVGNEFFILDEERLEAVHEILSNRKIPRESVKSFLKNPTAFIDASLVDLDNGVSARLQGATEFVQAYFGDIEKTGLDWFQSDDSTPTAEKPFDLQKIETVEDLEEVRNLFEEALQTGSSSFIYEEQVVEVSEPAKFEKQLKDVEEKLLNYSPHNDIEKTTATVVDIITNDEDEVFEVPVGVICKELIDKQIFSDDNLLRTPYPHQEEGIRWLLANIDLGMNSERGSGVILADDMGLGKTYMTLVAISEVMQRNKLEGRSTPPVMLVAPVALLENWKDEIEVTFKESPFEDVVILQGAGDLRKYKITGSKKETAQQLGDSGIRYALKVGKEFGHERLDLPNRLVLMSYAALRDYQFSLSKIHWFVAAFDEAQNLKNPNALQTRAAKALNADFRLLATGTPVENSLKDFWCLADTAVPGLMGSWKEFRTEFVAPILKSNDDPEVKLSVGQVLRNKIGHFMLRRTKAEELEGLPAKHIYTGLKESVNNGPKTLIHNKDLARNMRGAQLEKYQQIIENVKSSENKQKVALSALMEMRLVSIHDDIDGVIAELPKNKSATRTMESSAKLGCILQVLEQIKGRREKAIIFVTAKKVQTMLAALLQSIHSIPIAVVNGDTKAVSVKSEQTRKKIIDEFQNKPGFGTIIMSPVAAGVGLTVTGANNVIHLERHWNPAKEDQATDRVYRIGQEKTVNVYLPVSLHPDFDSFDVMLDKLLTKKTILGDAVVSPGIVTGSDMFKEVFNSES